MYAETQSELFIRTLTDLVNELRAQQMARQLDRHEVHADRYTAMPGVFAPSTE